MTFICLLGEFEWFLSAPQQTHNTVRYIQYRRRLQERKERKNGTVVVLTLQHSTAVNSPWRVQEFFKGCAPELHFLHYCIF